MGDQWDNAPDDWQRSTNMPPTDEEMLEKRIKKLEKDLDWIKGLIYMEHMKRERERG